MKYIKYYEGLIEDEPTQPKYKIGDIVYAKNNLGKIVKGNTYKIKAVMPLKERILKNHLAFWNLQTVFYIILHNYYQKYY